MELKSNEISLSIMKRSSFCAVLLIFFSAMIMGLPTLRGGFVGGDDHRLVLNHVLVNRPSLSHAVELFCIIHRDLYQPLPLLSFQTEFAIGQLFGMFDQGIEGATWFFHFNNVLLHALNAVLVWFVVRMLHQGVAKKLSNTNGNSDTSASVIAFIAALLFAVHPMQTEVVAWLNGRMILMSTFFSLLSLLAFHRWIHSSSTTSSKQKWITLGWGCATIVFVIFCSISKVRIGLPILLGIVLITQRNVWSRRALILWTLCTVVVGVFVLVNVHSTSEAQLFTDAAEQLKGPRAARVILSIDHYIRHFFWPVGLASYYPTPSEVRWSDQKTLQAIFLTIPVLIFWGFFCLRNSMIRWATLWFWSTIAVMLPFIPARNILAADRYMYLPIIGLCWLIAILCHHVYQRCSIKKPNPLLNRSVILCGCGFMVVMIGMCWHVASFYETPFKKTLRITQIFPDVPRVWNRLGWSYYRLDQYDEAVECAQKELHHDSPNVKSDAYQLMGMSAYHSGDSQQAVLLLKRAIEIEPDHSSARRRLAKVYEGIGQLDDAITYYEQAVEILPRHNPTLTRLARVYRQTNRPDDAKVLYQQSLQNNPYDIDATMGLVELDLQNGSQESNLSAMNRLETLLDWMPDNIDARVNLGVVYQALQRTDRAIQAYIEVLKEHPLHVTASLNLAQIYQATNRVQEAARLYGQAIQGGLYVIEQAEVIHDFYIDQGALSNVVALWKLMKKEFPQSRDARIYSAFSNALVGKLGQAEDELTDLSDEKTNFPLINATKMLIALLQKRYDDAQVEVDAICSEGDHAREARRRLLSALQMIDQQKPHHTWIYCLTTRLLVAQGQLDAARKFIQLCEQNCDDSSCRKYAQSIRTKWIDR